MGVQEAESVQIAAIAISFIHVNSGCIKKGRHG
jgi:hypothetical protein